MVLYATIRTNLTFDTTTQDPQIDHIHCVDFVEDKVNIEGPAAWGHVLHLDNGELTLSDVYSPNGIIRNLAGLYRVVDGVFFPGRIPLGNNTSERRSRFPVLFELERMSTVPLELGELVRLTTENGKPTPGALEGAKPLFAKFADAYSTLVAISETGKPAMEGFYREHKPWCISNDNFRKLYGNHFDALKEALGNPRYGA